MELHILTHVIASHVKILRYVMADNHRIPEKKVSNFEKLPSVMLLNVSIAMNVFLLYPNE
jgi:hypothetical protein